MNNSILLSASYFKSLIELYGNENGNPLALRPADGLADLNEHEPLSNLHSSLKQYLLTHDNVLASIAPLTWPYDEFEIREHYQSLINAGLLSYVEDPQLVTPETFSHKFHGHLPLISQLEFKLKERLKFLSDFLVLSGEFASFLGSLPPSRIILMDSHAPPEELFPHTTILALTEFVDFETTPSEQLFSFAYLHHLSKIYCELKRQENRFNSYKQTGKEMAWLYKRPRWISRTDQFAQALESPNSLGPREAWVRDFLELLDGSQFLFDNARELVHSCGGKVPWAFLDFDLFAEKFGDDLVQISELLQHQSSTVFATSIFGSKSDDHERSDQRASLKRVRVSLNGSDPLSLSNCTLNEVADLRKEPAFASLQNAFAAIYEELSKKESERFDKVKFKWALEEVEVFRQTPKWKRFASVTNRFVTYASLPVGIVEWLATGTVWGGLSVATTGMTFQGASDAPYDADKWLIRVRE